MLQIWVHKPSGSVYQSPSFLWVYLTSTKEHSDIRQIGRNRDEDLEISYLQSGFRMAPSRRKTSWLVCNVE
jgi:23S rRNA C2498 (ribose-2'-O)-methylase RlmM